MGERFARLAETLPVLPDEDAASFGKRIAAEIRAHAKRLDAAWPCKFCNSPMEPRNIWGVGGKLTTIGCTGCKHSETVNTTGALVRLHKELKGTT